MNESITINYDNEKPTVSGRNHHAALKVETRYNERMCGYGFFAGRDFYSILSKSDGGRPCVDHYLSIAMAKDRPIFDVWKQALTPEFIAHGRFLVLSVRRMPRHRKDLRKV